MKRMDYINSSGKKFSRRGAVLIIVMVISLCLVTIALYFGDSMLLEYRAADNVVEGYEASQAIEGARRYIQFILKNSEDLGYIPDPESYKSEKVKIGNASFWFVGRPGGETSEDEKPAFGMVCESSRLNLNTATREMLEGLPGMTSTLAAAIIDWRDTNMELSPGGAESQHYLLLDNPYNCKDGAFETVEELRLVMDAEWDVLYGEDTNQNGILDANENDGDKSPPDDNADGILDAGIIEYLTAYSREPNQRSDGSPRINVRTQRQELRDLLRNTFGEERANQIEQATGGNTQNVRSVLEYYIISRMTAAEFAQIEDALTVSNEQTIPGRVNVNTAPSEVLACLPGMDEGTAEKVVSARTQKSLDDMKSLAWVADVLEREQCIEAGPYLTTRCYQFRADISAVGLNGRGYRRDLLVFDTRGGEPRVVYRRDLARAGWALGSKIRKEYLQRERKEE
ncbi:general secretion pathway protein GspK [Candidatus Sumerlaeota bacterium]|nr:general secretion pathway protein GspK [Candidatus Sumerlaeota bacterium]